MQDVVFARGNIFTEFYFLGHWFYPIQKTYLFIGQKFELKNLTSK